MGQLTKNYATDETIREVADLLFGGGADQLIAKMNPTQDEVAQKKDKRLRGATAGLSAIGAAAGAGGLAYGAADMRAARKAGTKIRLRTKALVPLEIAGLGGEVLATKILHGDVKHKKKKPVTKSIKEIAQANPKKSLTRATLNRAENSEFVKCNTGKLKKLPSKITKAKGPKKPGFFKNIKNTAANAERMTAHGATAAENLSRMTTRASKQVRRGRLAAVTGLTVGAGGVGYGIGAKKKAKKVVVEHKSQPKPFVELKKDLVEYVKKDGGTELREQFDVVWRGEISKVDADRQQVFGWASIVEVDGAPVVDLQGDYISVEEIEKSAYSYVQKSRKGGNMHARDGADPHHVSDMIESFVVTPEKKEKMGLPDSVPTGWWVGYQVHDAETWDLVKSGKRTGFSIHGSGTRKAI